MTPTVRQRQEVWLAYEIKCGVEKEIRNDEMKA